MTNDIIFEPLRFRNLTVKNRIFRSNTYGNFDTPDGSGTQARINWEQKFARGGVGAIISSIVPIHPLGRNAPSCAGIESDDRIPFWRRVGETVREYDCKYIVQLSYNQPQGSQMASQHMTPTGIRETIQIFADAARRVREAGLDGIELDATPSGAGRLLDDLSEKNAQFPANIIMQFLWARTNQRSDEYGGTWQNRSRLLLDIVRTIRQQVGEDFHLQVKIGDLETDPSEERQFYQWLEAAGVDALHAGRKIPYADNPSGDFPLDIEGDHVAKVREIKQAVNIPVLCTGGFQSASYIGKVINEGSCDAVTLARALIANNDLVKIFAQGKDSPDKPCSFCEKCRLNLAENPLGCYDLSRYDGDIVQMSREIMSVYS